MFTISLQGTHIDLTPAMRAYAQDKVSMLEKFFDSEHDDILVEIELEKTTAHHQRGDIFRAEIMMRTPHGSYRAEAEKEDLYAAIDVAKDELAGELQRDKKKRETSVKRGGRMFKDLMRRIGFGE